MLSFLNRRNIIILALSIFVFKFVHLSTVVLVPGFLSNIQGCRPTEDKGHSLAWVAVPMFIVVWLVADDGGPYELETDFERRADDRSNRLRGSIRAWTLRGQGAASRW